MQERIKKLRKTLDLTQQEFGDRIGIKRNTLANYEIGRNEPIDAVISLICREFNVNETWLRTGEGEMFSQTVESKLDQVCRDLQFGDMEREALRLYLRIDPKIRDQFAQSLFQAIQKEYDSALTEAPSEPITAADRSSKQKMEQKARAKAEAYYHQLLLEEEAAARSSALTGTELGKMA